MSVTSRPGPMTTASSGTPRSCATFPAAPATPGRRIPVISVNLVNGARSRWRARACCRPPRRAGTRPGDGRRLVVELGVAVRLGTCEPVESQVVEFVELAELDAVRVELVVLELHRLDQGRPLGRAPGRMGLAFLDLLDHLRFCLRLGHPERLEELDELAA